MKKIITKFIITAKLLLAFIPAAQAQSASALKKFVRVKIYLLDNFESSNLLRNLKMISVERRVETKFALRSAIRAQLAGATREENSQLLYSPVTGIKLISVQVKNKTAYMRFERTAAGDLDKTDALRFSRAVTKTALQFPEVQRTRIYLNGNLNFGGGKSALNQAIKYFSDIFQQPVFRIY